MIWKPNTPSNDDDARRAREMEGARRAALLTRVQLEILAYEGSVSEEHFDALIAAHPQTVSHDETGFVTPEFSRPASPLRLTYIQAMKSVVSAIKMTLFPWTRTLSEIDPMNLGMFTRDSPDVLANDLIAAILLIRNQALYHLFDEATATKIHACAVLVLLDTTDKTAIATHATYDQLSRVWNGAMVDLDLPNLAVARWIVNQSGLRTCKLELLLENPICEVILAKKLVHTCFCAWHAVTETTTLCPD
jgi:hypothetical protein